MQQGLSATLKVDATPDRSESPHGKSPSSEATAVLEQRLQLAQVEAARLRETIVKQVLTASAVSRHSGDRHDLLNSASHMNLAHEAAQERDSYEPGSCHMSHFDGLLSLGRST